MRKKMASKPVSSKKISSVKRYKFEKYAKRFKQHTAKAQYKSAIEQANLALKIVPNHMQVMADLAFCLLRDEQYPAAYKTYKHIFHSGELAHQQAGDTWLDGLAEVCGWLDKTEELQRFGCLSLRKSDAEVCDVKQLAAHHLDQPTIDCNLQKPRPQFKDQAASRHIISFSLFGDFPKYCEGAVINAQVAKELFPDWTCRFYIAQDVPLDVHHRLIDLGAQVVIIDAQTSAIHPLLWRFLVLDDQEVDYYMIRDADSLLSEKEQAAIEQWVASDYWFHHMRDYFTHTELLLAVMWAGARGSLTKITPLIEDYCQNYKSSERYIDQYFLKQFVWPQAKGSLLSHDQIFKFHNAQPFPKHLPLRWRDCLFHIGSNCSYQKLVVKVPQATLKVQSWQLLDTANKEVCRYTSTVKNKQMSLSLPFVYVQQIQRNNWRISLI